MNALAVVFALTAAVLAAVGTLIRQQATQQAESINRRWVIGAAVSVGAFGLQIAALVFGSVLLVQPLIVLSVLFELMIEARWTTRKPTVGQWVCGAAVAIGVGMLVVFARPVPAVHGRQEWVLDTVVFGYLLAVLVTFLLARRREGNSSALLLGLVSGSLFGLVAVQISSLSGGFDGIGSLLRNPTLYICLLTAFGAIAAQQRSFAKGSLQVSYPAMVASEPVVSMVLSLAVLGEKLSSHSVGTYVGAAGVVVMVAGVIGVARATADSDTALGGNQPLNRGD